jgi:hypothetical protein
MQGRSSGPQDTALLVEAVNQLEDRLINQLQNHTLELRHGFEGVHQRLDDLSVTLGRQIQKVLEDNAALKNMVQTLIAGTHDIPTLAIIVPEVSRDWQGITHPMLLLHNQYRLHFLCSHTKQIVPCGPEKTGYEIKVTRKWVKDAAPVLQVGLVLVKVALLASGIPLPVPNLSNLLTDATKGSKYLDTALQLLKCPIEDAADSAMHTMNSPLENVEVYDVDNLVAEHGVTTVAGRLQLQERSRKAYETIKTLLENTHGRDFVKSCGLRKVEHSSGRTAWVLDNDATERAWMNSPLPEGGVAPVGPLPVPAPDPDSTRCCGCCVS